MCGVGAKSEGTIFCAFTFSNARKPRYGGLSKSLAGSSGTHQCIPCIYRIHVPQYPRTIREVDWISCRNEVSNEMMYLEVLTISCCKSVGSYVMMKPIQRQLLERSNYYRSCCIKTRITKYPLSQVRCREAELHYRYTGTYSNIKTIR